MLGDLILTQCEKLTDCESLHKDYTFHKAPTCLFTALVLTF